MPRYDPHTMNALAELQRHDPDGWEHPMPTEKDYRKFERYAVDRYGKAVWDIYMQPGGWGDAQEV